jgi:hypothetical protein
MSLQTFAEQKNIKTLNVSPSKISNFSVQKTVSIGNNLSKLSQTFQPKEEKPKELTTWQWLSKQLMKPVGMVAAETEALGNAIGRRELYVPGKQALDVLTGKKTASFSEIWSSKGPEVGISQPVSTAIGFVFDIIADPLNFIGGGLTKLGKAANKVTSLKNAGKTISTTSKLGKYITKMGYSADDLVLAGTKLQQVEKGQRAFLQILNKPIIGGTKIYKATEKLNQIASASRITKGISNIFSTKTGIKNLDDLVDNYKNLSNYRKQKVFDTALDIQKRMRKMDSVEIKMIAEAIEKPSTKATIKNQTIVKLADDIEGLFKGIKKTEKGVGVLRGELAEYFPHIKAKEKFTERINAFFSPKIYNASLGAAKGRKISGTLGEINARFGKEFFESNPAVAYAQRGLASAKAVTAKEFLDEVGKKFFINAENAPIAFTESTNPLLKGLKADPDVVKVVDQYIQGLKPEELKLIIRAHDKVLNWWKGQVLISPSYHTRNMISNFWNNWLAGVNNPIVYEKARNVQSGKNLTKTLLITDAGEILTRGKVLELAKQKGVIGKGWYGADIARELGDEVGGLTARARKLSGLKFWQQDNILFKTNRAVGSAIEDNARLAHFIDYLQKGFSADDAARSVKKFLFDYADLTQTEKTILKRVFPFYTWTRKNVPLQLEQLIAGPEKYAALPKVIELIESGIADPKTDKYLNQYITENIPVKIGTDDKGNTQYFLMGSWLPAASAIDFLSQPIDSLIQMGTPLLKTPFELWANKSLFFKNTLGESSKIEHYYKQPTDLIGIPMRKKTATLMRNIRILNDLDKLMGTPARDEAENEWVVKLISVLFGKAVTYDVDRSRYFYQLETNERIQELVTAIRKAMQLGQDEHAKKLQEELQEFKKERGK